MKPLILGTASSAPCSYSYPGGVKRPVTSYAGLQICLSAGAVWSAQSYNSQLSQDAVAYIYPSVLHRPDSRTSAIYVIQPSHAYACRGV